ncbi:MAG TPA: adenylate/guanylate cyclase domain-containing protein, partial [Anaerolineae bacterium]|nr:adenylate/guanylate cyclase domain-containing protein [Anaerolineae bacterium]
MSALLETLASYVPSLVVRWYAEHPDPIITPGAERFPSAIFFADITGFTALTERLARLGPAGAEEVSRLLNDYFGQLIERVDAHGGDVVKFAGDALLALWPAVDEPLEAVVRRAAQCGLAAQAALHDYAAARDVRLSLRVGIGAGEMTSAHVGGVNGRWEFVATGAPLSQIGAIKTEALPGDVIVSPEAWSLAGQWFTGHALPTGSMRLESARDSLPPRRALRPALKAEMELPLRAYIPGAILERLAAGQSEWLAELRRVTVIFVNLPGQDDKAPRGLKQAQMITRALQSVLYRYEASIDKISVDDTGANLVAALGLPPWTHEDDAARGAQAALAIQSLLRELGLRPAIGVAGGLAFCGSVGTAARREYTMVGDVVNLAARLMQSARDDILCDAATAQAAHAQVEFESLPAIRVKGKAEPVAIYRPIRAARATARPHVTMIGRAAEWAMLSERMQNLLHGEPGGTVVLEGEAGIGKSRLVDEALRRAQELGLACLLGAGDAIEKNTPYHAWRDIFVKLLGLHAETDPENRREQILDRLRHDPQVASLAPLLNVALPVDLPENETTASMTDQARGDAARDVLLRLLNDLPRSEGMPDDRRPKVIVLEDAHWLDSASWALALLVSRRLERSLLIVTARPMSDPPPPEYLQL